MVTEATTEGRPQAPLIDAPRPTGGGLQTPEQQPADQPTKVTTTTTPERVKQSEVVEDGSPNLEIWLDRATQKLAAERLINRLQTVNDLSSKERPLTTIDRLIQKLGPEVISRLEKGDLTREDLAIAVFVLRDELLQKSLASGKLVKDIKTIEPTRLGKLEKIPLFGRLKRTVESPPSLQTQLEAAKPLSTEYTREIGFDQWTQDRILNDLVALNQLRTSVELSFYGSHLDDPLFDQDSISLYTAGRKTGNRLHDAVVDELMGTEGILTERFGGKTFLGLSQEDPIAAMQALYEANQRAITQFAGEAGRNLLKSEKPEVDTALIEKQVLKAEAKPTQEDLTKLQDTATKASTEFTDAETRLNTIEAPLDDAQKVLAEKQLAFDKASQNFTQISERLNPEIKRIQDRVELLYNSIQEPDPSLTPEQKADFQRNAATISQNASRTEATMQSYQDKLNQLLQTKIDAEIDLNTQKADITRLEQEAKDKGLDEAKENFSLKKAAKETAQTALKEAQEGTEKEISPEAKGKAKALREWVKVVTGYNTIIDARLSQAHGDEYTRERLADIKERPDGQIEGAERIREHIFRLINKGDYNPELARKMLSDETIARAIIWVYKLDSEIISTEGKTLNELLSDLNETKDMIRKSPEDKELSKEKTDQEKEIIKLVLPYLRSSQFKAGDLLRFMIHEGLKSAELGNPYLTLSEYYEKPKPELRLEAESIYAEGVGRTEESLNEKGEKRLVWRASTPKPVKLPGFERNDLPLHFSFPFIFDKDKASILYKTYIKMDKRSMQSLPRALDANLPSGIKEKLYDDTTGLLQSEKVNINEFIQIKDDVFDGEDRIVKLLDYLKNNVSEDAPKMLKISLANYFLERNPTERLESLKGLGGVGIPMKVNGVTSTVKNPDGGWGTVTKDYQIDFDNSGNFFLVDSITNERHELQSFYKRELDNFRESKGVQTLSQTDRKALNDQSFAKIQETLGEAILYAQSV